MWNRNEQTICAVSTPHGLGGISVIRISGSQALLISKKLSKSLSKKLIFESHRTYFSEIFDVSGNKVDEGLFTYFKNEKSYTGEEVVEISCHGSPFISQQILDLLVLHGCRIADKGEFTFRAYMNGKLDLIEAESVLALIQSQNKASSRLALRQLDGFVSNKFEFLISELTWCLAHIEASIDFSEQGVESASTDVLVNRLSSISENLIKIIDSYNSGRLIRDGIKLALIGEPNVGKSSLLNLILQNNKAIVTPIAGTTRDVIDGVTLYNETQFCISDTAGLRETNNEIEIIGIERSKIEAENADVVCLVFDSTAINFKEHSSFIKLHKEKKYLIILNKVDLISESQKTLLKNYFSNENFVIFSSAKDFNCREIILSNVLKLIGDISYLDEAVISSSRQLELTRDASQKIFDSINELKLNIGTEFVTLTLKEALISLQKILGQVFDDQIIDRVFSEFCLGK